MLNNSHVTVVTGFQTTIVNGSIVHPQSGPNGLVAIPNLNELWAGAGDSAIKVIDLSTNQIVANVSTMLRLRDRGSRTDPLNVILDQHRWLLPC